MQLLLFFLVFIPALTLDSTAQIAWEQGPGWRRSKVNVTGTAEAGFQLLTAKETGIQFTNSISRLRSILNRNLLNGSGVAAGDIDGDGLADLYFCGIERSNALYRNLGNWKFGEITREAGVACDGQNSTGAVFADVDADGDLDLLVSSLGGGVRLFKNDGKGTFTETTAEARVASRAGSMSMALADVDGDGDLDLYVANYRKDTVADQPSIVYGMQMVRGRPVVAFVNNEPITKPEWTNRFMVSGSSEVLELGEPDVLYLNDGRGKFTAIPWTEGAFLDEDGRTLSETPRDWGLAVQIRDLNGDGSPDIYVCNDYFTPDRIWINDGKGKFRAIPRTAVRTISSFSMGVDVADIDRDGNVDLFVVDMLSPDHRKRHVQLGERMPVPMVTGLIENRPQSSRNTLQLNRGDGTFAEIGFFAGVEASDWSWGPAFLDVDLDGYEDLLIPNGQMRDFQNIDMANKVGGFKGNRKVTQAEINEFIGQFPVLRTPNIAYRNKGNRTFEEVGAKWGFATPGISQGMALADLDNDGDLDVIVNNLDERPWIYRNTTGAARLALRLKTAGGADAIGAQIKVSGGPVPQSQEIVSGGRYLSGDQCQRTFAAGNSKSLSVEIKWRDGTLTSLTAEPNYLYEVSQIRSVPGKPAAPQPPALFSSFNGMPPFAHADPFFNDLERQPLLTKLLSQLGPGLSWHDIDRDGWEDLIIPSGRGGQPSVFWNLQGREFRRATNAFLARPASRDQTTALGMLQGLLIGSCNYEDGSTNGGLVRVYEFQRGASGDSISGVNFCAGPLAFADVDGDGDLDLFVGGRSVAGRYPEPADSLLLRNEGGRFVVMQRWPKLGLVSGATFSDLDADGVPELLLATEWGPIRVFKLEQGKYIEQTKALGLAEDTGWWNAVATGDFDGDGRMDIVAANWGLNTAYRTSREHPRRMYYGDLDGNGTVDLIECRFDVAMQKEVPEKTFNLFRAAMPYLQETITSFEQFGSLSVAEIFGENLKQAAVLEARTFETSIYLNRGGHFERHPLPAEAQFAPAFGIAVADFNGDGAEDIVLSQNFFSLAPNEPRTDGGRGLLLLGDGKGAFRAVPGQESGIKTYGEQRGCAAADFDHDGRVDVVIAQNANAPELWHNDRSEPGLRVRLQGDTKNPDAIGAALRMKRGTRFGVRREVQAGSGYWSQNSAAQVLTRPAGAGPMELVVQWPGGAQTRTTVPAEASEIEIAPNGSAKVLH